MRLCKRVSKADAAYAGRAGSTGDISERANGQTQREQMRRADCTRNDHDGTIQTLSALRHVHILQQNDGVAPSSLFMSRARALCACACACACEKSLLTILPFPHQEWIRFERRMIFPIPLFAQQISLDAPSQVSIAGWGKKAKRRDHVLHRTDRGEVCMRSSNASRTIQAHSCSVNITRLHFGSFLGVIVWSIGSCRDSTSKFDSSTSSSVEWAERGETRLTGAA
jgi:hypothetical protein